MGIELIAAIAGTAIAIPATWKLIDKLIITRGSKGCEHKDETKESRKDLKATLIENTKASTMQISSNDNVNNTLKELTVVVREKL